MRNGKGWVKERGRVPAWCPLPPRCPRSSAGLAMGGRGGPPRQGAQQRPLRLENPHVCGERGGEGVQGGQEEPLQLRLGALGLLPGTNRWH